MTKAQIEADNERLRAALARAGNALMDADRALEWQRNHGSVAIAGFALRKEGAPANVDEMLTRIETARWQISVEVKIIHDLVFGPCVPASVAYVSTAWPNGCPKPSSCARNKRCMYGCAEHKGRDIAKEVEDETARRESRASQRREGQP